MGLVQVKIIRSDNAVFVLGTGSEWRILSDGLIGFDYPKISIFSEKKAMGDGSLLIGHRVDDRDCGIVAKTTKTEMNGVLRREAISFFNPSYTYKIYVTYQEETRWTEGVLQGFTCPAKNIHLPMTLTVKFYCPDVHLKSVDSFGKDIASVRPQFGFPYIQTRPNENKIMIVADAFNFGKKISIVNSGDATTYPIAKINFSGSVVNPAIVKDGTFVRVKGEFKSGDILEIDCEAQTIRKNGKNWIQHIDRASDFLGMGLDVGTSSIGFSAENGETNMQVYIYYNILYLGI